MSQITLMEVRAVHIRDDVLVVVSDQHDKPTETPLRHVDRVSLTPYDGVLMAEIYLNE